MSDVRLTQQVVEALRTGRPDVQLTHVVVEVVRPEPPSAVALTARLELLVSSVSVVNALGLRPLTVSALWVVSGGTSPFTYGWTFELPTASATISAVTRTVSAGSGDLRTALISAVVSDASAASVTATALVYVRYAGVPNYWDGKVQPENQYRRRTWPT